MSKVKPILVLAIIALGLISISAFANPQGPVDIAKGDDESRTTGDSTGGKLVLADAGNMTSITINSTRISDRWQGYYGNITGTITLDDAANNTLYSWELAGPQGEIYAVNDSKAVQWGQVKCLNISGEGTSDNVTLTNLEAALGMGATDKDGVNETFNLSFTGSFTIGSSLTIDSTSGCRAVSLNVNDVSEQVTFNETILTDNTSNHNVIYVSLLEAGSTGFSSTALDFQMIVGDDGDVVAATDYYFYVELS